MSYIVEQKVKGKIYLYKVESYWDKTKQQSRQKRTFEVENDYLCTFIPYNNDKKTGKMNKPPLLTRRSLETTPSERILQISVMGTKDFLPLHSDADDVPWRRQS